MNFELKPYKLENTVQNYAWGTKNEEAFIPQLTDSNIKTDLPYAELWVGAHPKSPSKILIGNEKFQLNEIIKKYPNEILGRRVAEKFDNKLPFLFKILSAGQALSIQTHPNKLQAEELHKKDPANYPDDNHKPEIAIAYDSLNALVGFKPKDELLTMLNKYDGLRNLIGEEIINQFKNDLIPVKNLYEKILFSTDSEIKIAVNSILKEIKVSENKLDYEEQFLNEYKKYGYDVGLFSILIFNYVKLKQNEGIFTGAGIPHAYLKGNIIECMANSDNVVRAGLTPKFKDVKTLLNILDYSTQKPKILFEVNNNAISYPTEVEEFELTIYAAQNETNKFDTNDSVNIIFALQGEVTVKNGAAELQIQKGDSCLIPAELKEYKIISDQKSSFVKVAVPE